MDEAKRSVETTGETVEEAISKGLSELGASPFQVVVEVLEEPSRGVMGVGARPAKVRLQMLMTAPPPMPPKPPAVAQEPPRVDRPSAPPRSSQEKREPRERLEKRDNRSRGDARNDRRTTSDRPSQNSPSPKGGDERQRDRSSNRDRRPKSENLGGDAPYDYDVEMGDGDAALFSMSAPIEPEQYDDEVQIGLVVLRELLDRLDYRGQIVVRRALPGEDGGTSPWVLDITDNPALKRLIGRRGETLAALQYIARLVTSRELQRRSDIIIDIEGHKARRSSVLHGLALRMADEAVASRRTVTLEPMPPHERRVIHLALRGRTDVATKSVGEGESRKITILPMTTNS